MSRGNEGLFPSSVYLKIECKLPSDFKNPLEHHANHKSVSFPPLTGFRRAKPREEYINTHEASRARKQMNAERRLTCARIRESGRSVIQRLLIPGRTLIPPSYPVAASLYPHGATPHPHSARKSQSIFILHTLEATSFQKERTRETERSQSNEIIGCLSRVVGRTAREQARERARRHVSLSVSPPSLDRKSVV